MKISKQILENLNACRSGLNAFVSVHGEKELSFYDCVKSESNSMNHYFWFIRKQVLTNEQKKDLQLFAIECAERVLLKFENKYPDDKRPRIVIEKSKLYLSNESTLDALSKARRDIVGIDAAVAYAVDTAAYAAAYATNVDIVPYVAYAVDVSADAAYTVAYTVAYDAKAAAVYASAEKSWQKQRLAEIVSGWVW